MDKLKKALLTCKLWIPFNIFWLLNESKPKCNFSYWSKMTLKLSSYLLPKFSRVPFTIVLISGISTMVNGTLLNFDKRYEDDLWVIFDQWQKLHLGLNVLSNQKILKGIYYSDLHAQWNIFYTFYSCSSQLYSDTLM